MHELFFRHEDDEAVQVVTELLIQLGIKYDYNWLAGWKILHQ